MQILAFLDHLELGMHRAAALEAVSADVESRVPGQRAETLRRLLDSGLSEAAIRTILPESWTAQAFVTLHEAG